MIKTIVLILSGLSHQALADNFFGPTFAYRHSDHNLEVGLEDSQLYGLGAGVIQFQYIFGERNTTRLMVGIETGVFVGGEFGYVKEFGNAPFSGWHIAPFLWFPLGGGISGMKRAGYYSFRFTLPAEDGKETEHAQVVGLKTTMN